MAYACRDGISTCIGCGYCLEIKETCDVCRRHIINGDRYYKLFRKVICEDCIEKPESELCDLCRKPAPGGIRYNGFVLCRSCSGVATGYMGYM